MCRSLLARFHFVDTALHIEIALRHRVMFAIKDLLEATNGLRYGNLFTLASSKHLRHAERLAQEALDLARAEYCELVLGRQLVHAENRDDVLQVLEPLQ